LGFINRRNDLSFEQFDAHWRTTHADLVLGAGHPGPLRGYVQNVACRERVRGIVSDFDGAPELWIDGETGVKVLFDSPEFQTAYREDSPKFVTLPTTSFFITDRLISGARPQVGQIRLLRLINLPSDTGKRLSMQQAWHKEVTPFGVPAGTPPPTALIRSEILSSPSAAVDPSAYMGIESSWWATVDHLAEAWERREGQGVGEERILVATERAQLQPF